MQIKLDYNIQNEYSIELEIPDKIEERVLKALNSKTTTVLDEEIYEKVRDIILDYAYSLVFTLDNYKPKWENVVDLQRVVLGEPYYFDRMICNVDKQGIIDYGNKKHQ